MASQNINGITKRKWHNGNKLFEVFHSQVKKVESSQGSEWSASASDGVGKLTDYRSLLVHHLNCV